VLMPPPADVAVLLRMGIVPNRKISTGHFFGQAALALTLAFASALAAAMAVIISPRSRFKKS
jgi:hypothetical protein